MTGHFMPTLPIKYKLSAAVLGIFALAACVTSGSKEGEEEPVNTAPVTPAQISPEECVNYVQLKRDADYLCELADGSTRHLKDGERRTTPLSREEIERVMIANREDTELCFETVLANNEKAEGKLYISFEIEADGKVANARYNTERSTYKNEKLADCFVQKAKSWRFPVLRTDELLEINYPLVNSINPDASASEQAAPAKK